MRYIRSTILVLIGAICLYLCHSCSTCSRTHTIDKITVNLDMLDLSSDSSIYLDVGGMVLYALPTPIEASMLIKNWGIPYPELLNDPANASKYLTKKKMAVNLGVYVTDIVLSGLYEQTQAVLKYRQALQQLVDGLGLQAAVDQSMLQKVEDNMNNKNELMKIISDIYASCTEFLSEDDRDFYALAMLSGGWVEGMYIATNMIDEKNITDEQKIRNIVMENKNTFDILWLALSQMDVIPEDAVYLMLDMSYVAHLFGHQTLLTVPKNTEIINTDKITPAFFAELKNCIQVLRQSFTKL